MKYLNLVVAFAITAILKHFSEGMFQQDGVILALDPIIGASLIMGGTSLLSKYLPGGEKQEQMALETPEQKAARAKLMDFANTGKFGDFTAGADVGVGKGADYRMTGYDDQSMTELQRLLSSGIPSQYKMGDDALRSILDGSQENMDKQFSAFNTGTDRAMREAGANLKRGAGFAGNLYSTGTIRNLGDIEARGFESKTGKLAELTNQAMDRRLAAVPLAYQSAESQTSNSINRIAAAQNYGSLARDLNNKMVAARDAEILRRRTELQLPIDAAKTVAGSGSNFGVPSVQAPSPYSDLLGMVGQLGGMYMMSKGSPGGSPAKEAAATPGAAAYASSLYNRPGSKLNY